MLKRLSASPNQSIILNIVQKARQSQLLIYLKLNTFILLIISPRRLEDTSRGIP